MCRGSCPENLGARHDTVFYNTATQYTIDLLIARQDATTVILKHGTGPEEFPLTAIQRLSAWLKSIFGDGYTRNGGIPFVSSFGSGDPGPYRARYPDPPVNIDWLLAVLGALSLGRAAGLDTANGLSNLFDGLNHLKEKEPYIPGQGALKPEEYEARREEYSKKDSTANKKKEPITVPVKPVRYPTDMMHHSGSTQAQHLHMEVLIAPAQHDTIHRENQDSINTVNFIESAYRRLSRDTIIEESKWGERSQLEMLRRQDTVYYINIHLTSEGIIYKDHITGESISKQKYEEIKRSE